MALTEKKKIFCDEYLIDLNGTRAYKIAYPNIKNDNTASVAASRLMKEPEVAVYIKKRIQDRQKRTEITQDWVLEELRKIASVNGTDFARIVIKNGYPEVELIATDKIPEEKKAAIASIKQGKYGINIESYDKVKALELLGRHLGMFKDRVEVSGLEEEQSKLSELLEQRRNRRGAT